MLFRSVLARWIAAKGHYALHVAEFGMAGAPDQQIWEKAIELKSVIISKDDDFIQMARTVGGPQIIWVTSGNTSKRARCRELWKRHFHKLSKR